MKRQLVVCVALAFLLLGTGLAYGMGGGGGGGRFGYVQTSSGNGSANDGTHAQVATGGSSGPLDAVGTDAVTIYEPGILVLLGSGLIGILGLRRTFRK